jgi:predicted outer membrane protein
MKEAGLKDHGAANRFDREYVKTMVKDPQQDVAEFRRMHSGAVDPNLKAWVAKTPPTIENHPKTIEGHPGADGVVEEEARP